MVSSHKTRITISLPKNYVLYLDKKARESGFTKSEVLSDILFDFIIQEARNGKKAQS